MNILLVDDDAVSRKSVAKFLQKVGHDIVECASGTEALSLCQIHDFPLILTDIRMPGMSGIELLQIIRSNHGSNQTEVVLFTGHGTVETAVEALRIGAFDYLQKPINIKELLVVIDKAAEHQALRRENDRLTKHFSAEVKAATAEVKKEVERLREIVSRAVGINDVGIFSETMQEVFQRAQHLHSDRSIPVMIYGETGTGKELIARLIHFGESVCPAPFIDINCAALTASLFESELFGYEGGSFTGGLAKGQRGKIDLAKGGTLFLDEIGEMPLEMQAKLLRVLQEKEYYRVGGLRKEKADVRIIGATNVDLADAVHKGKFRKDLYYRLNVAPISIAPLRQHPESIIPLANMFLKRFAGEKKKGFTTLSSDAASALQAHSWPGNVRELSNAIERAVFMNEGMELQATHLALPNVAAESRETSGSNLLRPELPLQLPEAPFSLDDYIDKIIIATVNRFGGNKTAAAEYLGMSRRALAYRADKLLL